MRRLIAHADFNCYCLSKYALDSITNFRNFYYCALVYLFTCAALKYSEYNNQIFIKRRPCHFKQLFSLIHIAPVLRRNSITTSVFGCKSKSNKDDVPKASPSTSHNAKVSSTPADLQICRTVCRKSMFCST